MTSLWDSHVAGTRAYDKAAKRDMATDRFYGTLDHLWATMQAARRIRGDVKQVTITSRDRVYGAQMQSTNIGNGRPFAPRPPRVCPVDANGDTSAAPWFGAAPIDDSGSTLLGVDVIMARQVNDLTRVRPAKMAGLIQHDDVYIPDGLGPQSAYDAAMLDMATEQAIVATGTVAHQKRLDDAARNAQSRLLAQVKNLRAENDKLQKDADAERRGKKAAAEKARRARIAEAARMLPDGTTVWLSA